MKNFCRTMPLREAEARPRDSVATLLGPLKIWIWHWELEPQNTFAMKCRGLVIEGPLPGKAREQLKWAVVGAGPVGFALALSLAESMQEPGLAATVPRIDVYESRWIEWSQADAKWRRASVFFQICVSFLVTIVSFFDYHRPLPFAFV